MYSEPNNYSKPEPNKTGAEAKPHLQGKVYEHKKSFKDQLIDTFVLGSFSDIEDYLINKVAIPTAKKAILDTVAMFLNVNPPANSNKNGYSNDPVVRDYRDYRRYSKPSNQVYSGYSGNYTRQGYSDFIYESASDAEAVIEYLKRILTQYNFVPVAEVYIACGKQSSPTDYDWGWYDLKDACVARRGPNEFFIKFPPCKSR